MAHIELRELSADTAPAAPASGPFEEWIAARRAQPDAATWVVTDGGAIAGAAAAFTTDGEREIAYRLAPGSEAAADETLRLLVSLEPERPLYARLPVGDEASAAILARIGFTELDRTPAEVRLVLPPTLE